MVAFILNVHVVGFLCIHHYQIYNLKKYSTAVLHYRYPGTYYQ
eukprot:SAG11_NODE_912_length_6580_cov_2.243018_8_plen_43_part_00